MPRQDYALSVIGIANSVELFNGELNCSAKAEKGNLLESNQLLGKNEVKLLFKPYTREDLQVILTNLYREHLKSNGYAADELVQDLIKPQSFQLAASKMDKVSGDIRVCFEILRNTVTKKIDSLRPYLPKSASATKSFNDS